MTTKVETRLDGPLGEWLASRANRTGAASPSLQARDELALWRAVPAAELRRVRLTLTEACHLAEITAGTILHAVPALGARLYTEVTDALKLAREHPLPEEIAPATRWGADDGRLLDVLGGLGPAADHALRDALPHWRAEGAAATVAGFRAVGLAVIVTPDTP